MFGKIISLGIVAFWLVMMTLLVRQEFFEAPPHPQDVPVEMVMQKMFQGEGSSDLTIFHLGERVGRCTLQISRVGPTEDPSYAVRSELALRFSLLGRTLRLQSNTDSEFDPRYQMRKFRSHTSTSDAEIIASGDFETQEVELLVRLGSDHQETHKFPFAALARMGPSGAMGLFGMGGLPAPGSGSGEGRLPVAAMGAGGSGPTTTAREVSLRLGQERIPAWLVHTRYEDSLWSKVYVNTVGEILKVETSFGVTMLGTQFAEWERPSRP